MGEVSNLLGVGVDAQHLTAVHTACRMFVVFIAALVIVRIADKRFLGKMSAFDVIIGFTLGSMLSRAVTGSSPMLPTLAASIVLIVLHRVLAVIAFHTHAFGRLVKGCDETLVVDGKVDQKQMRRFQLTEHDLMEEARLNGQINSTRDIRLAVFERNGMISVIPAKG